MFTVKLCHERTGRTRHVECVEVLSERAPTRVRMRQADGTEEVVEIHPGDSGGEFSVAYVENARGKTVQVVRS